LIVKAGLGRVGGKVDEKKGWLNTVPLGRREGRFEKETDIPGLHKKLRPLELYWTWQRLCKQGGTAVAGEPRIRQKGGQKRSARAHSSMAGR